MSEEEFLKERYRQLEIKLGMRKDNGIRKWFCMTCYKYLGTDRTKIPISSHVLGTYCSKECWNKAKKDFVKALSSIC